MADILEEIIASMREELEAVRVRCPEDATKALSNGISLKLLFEQLSDIRSDRQAYFSKVRSMNLKNPAMIGFGISNYQTLHSAWDNASGAIIGSKFVQLLDQAQGDASESVSNLFEALGR